MSNDVSKLSWKQPASDTEVCIIPEQSQLSIAAALV
jgi:hypothetical protein